MILGGKTIRQNIDIKKRLFAFISLISIIFFCLANNAEALEKSLYTGPAQRYILQLPQNYSPQKKYPLLIAVHWASGTAMQQINEWKFLANKNGYILLAPQFSEGYQRCPDSDAKRLIGIINDAESKFSIDKDRIFLIGFSGGAQFAHRFAYRHPFIKAVCVLAAGDYDPAPSSPQAKSVKYFIAVGEQDERYSKMLRLYDLLKRKGYDATFKSFPLVGHTLHPSIKEAVMNFLSKVDL